MKGRKAEMKLNTSSLDEGLIEQIDLSFKKRGFLRFTARKEEYFDEEKKSKTIRYHSLSLRGKSLLGEVKIGKDIDVTLYTNSKDDIIINNLMECVVPREEKKRRFSLKNYGKKYNMANLKSDMEKVLSDYDSRLGKVKENMKSFIESNDLDDIYHAYTDRIVKMEHNVEEGLMKILKIYSGEKFDWKKKVIKVKEVISKKKSHQQELFNQINAEFANIAIEHLKKSGDVQAYSEAMEELETIAHPIRYRLVDWKFLDAADMKKKTLKDRLNLKKIFRRKKKGTEDQEPLEAIAVEESTESKKSVPELYNGFNFEMAVGLDDENQSITFDDSRLTFSKQNLRSRLTSILETELEEGKKMSSEYNQFLKSIDIELELIDNYRKERKGGFEKMIDILCEEDMLPVRKKRSLSVLNEEISKLGSHRISANAVVNDIFYKVYPVMVNRKVFGEMIDITSLWDGSIGFLDSEMRGIVDRYHGDNESFIDHLEKVTADEFKECPSLSEGLCALVPKFYDNKSFFSSVRKSLCKEGNWKDKINDAYTEFSLWKPFANSIERKTLSVMTEKAMEWYDSIENDPRRNEKNHKSVMKSYDSFIKYIMEA